MTATAPVQLGIDSEPGGQMGWYIGAALALAVLAIGLGLWFTHHP